MCFILSMINTLSLSWKKEESFPYIKRWHVRDYIIGITLVLLQGEIEIQSSLVRHRHMKGVYMFQLLEDVKLNMLFIHFSICYVISFMWKEKRWCFPFSLFKITINPFYYCWNGGDSIKLNSLQYGKYKVKLQPFCISI